jgi:hypothetical protein
MATRTWIGSAANIRQIDTITIANTWAAADTCTITIANIDFVVTIGTLVTTAQVATTIYQALTGTTFTDTTATCTISIADGGATFIPQFNEFTATNTTASVVHLTANQSSPQGLAGKPFTVSVTEVTAGSGTATEATATTATGQFFWDQADNWSGNTVPVDDDTIVFDDGSVDLRYNLTTTIQPAVFTKLKKYSGKIGLAVTNQDNSAKPYAEYRTPRYLTFDNNTVTTTFNLEVGDGPGSNQLYISSGTGQAIVNVFGAGQSTDNLPPTMWIGTHASNVVNNLNGNIGIAYYPSESAVVATLVTGDGPQSNAKTFCGSGCTLGIVRLNGGSQVTYSAVTTATEYAGQWDHYAGTITTYNGYGGTFTPHAAITITNASVYNKLDMSKSAGAITFTNLVQVYAGAEINDPNGRIVFSAGYKLNCRPDQAKIIRPPGDTVTYS